MADPAAPIADDIAKMNFEDALKELESIVENLEGGEGRLDEAIGSFERGVALKLHCETKLREAQARVEKVVPGSDSKGGVADVEPADID